MKKINLVSVTAYARKSYITVSCTESDGHSGSIYLTGDVPDNIEGFTYLTGTHRWHDQGTRVYSTGEILNVLSEYGYEVEFAENNQYFLLSKEISTGQTISEGDVNKDGEVNIGDINKIVALILGIVKDNPSILEQIKD